MSIAAVFLYFRKYPAPKPIRVLATQSTAFEAVNRGIIKEFFKPDLVTQATKHADKDLHHVAFHENTAYWIENNVFYSAVIDESGQVDLPNKQVVDTINASDVELQLFTFIVEKLTEGKKD